MNFYEHTIIARQDTSPSELKQLTDKYLKIIEKNEGVVIKTENWGLLNLSYLIKKNRKGSYIHFKIKGKGKVVEELEKKLVVEKENLEKLIFSHAATPIENPMRIKVARRFVARIKTEINKP